MAQDQSFTDVDEFLAHVGRKEFQNETGKSTQLVQRAKVDGVFPDSWFWLVKPFCDSRSIGVPEHLFRGKAKLLKTETAE
ncbi:hypothetical protein [Ruegeria arenilitoris]|uniref:hypothetical protein n=1 Tax=Ruegeria arenilitoris TaxID=1173585 RepID=UPI00147F7859|nr:hypothetical protein [Ruegeria arenilitoris]